MPVIYKHTSRFQFLILGLSLLLSTSIHATSNESTEAAESLQSEGTEDECSCSIRKRQQVERRLEKKKQAEQE